MTTPTDAQPVFAQFSAFMVMDGWQGGQVVSSSSEPFVTPLFTLDQAPWAIVWSADSGGMSVTVNDAKASDNIHVEEVLDTSRKGRGVRYLDRAGTFYLTVVGKGRWVVKVVAVD